MSLDSAIESDLSISPATNSSYAQVITLFSLQFGTSLAQARRLIEELSNVILLNLKEGSNRVFIPRLGEFSVGTDQTFTFKPSYYAIKYLGTSKSYDPVTLLDLSTDCAGYLESIRPDSDYLQGIPAAILEPDADGLSIEAIFNEAPLRTPKAQYLTKIRRPNRPDPVRKSFLDYLKWGFPSKEDWHAPNRVVYKFQDIKIALGHYRRLNPHNYRALWTRWTSDQSREFIAENFGFSSSSIRRRWDEGISTILVMLQFPDLTPENILYLYGSNY